MDKQALTALFEKYIKKLRITPAWDIKLEFVEDPTWRKTGDFVMEQAEALEPSKIFLCFGDEDIKAEGFLAGEFSYEYKELVSDIKKKFPDCQIYILPVMADGAEEADNALKNICGDIAEFIPLSAEAKHDAGKIFRELKTFLHGRNVIFGQAWN